METTETRVETSPPLARFDCVQIYTLGAHSWETIRNRLRAAA